MSLLETILAALTVIAAVGAALIGGLFFAFSTFVMRALGERPAAEGMAAMVSINRVILRSLFIPVFLGTAVLSAILAIYAVLMWTSGSPWLIGGAFFYLVANLWLTIAFNVPLNNAIDRADPAADNAALWADYLDRWTQWNHVRTVACLLASTLFIVAVIV